MLNIPEFFSGKNILITGGSGFVGKVLIEKLLRSCPDIGNIFVIIRPKWGTDSLDRIKLITDNVLFDSIKESNPTSLTKIIAIPGNTQQLRLGLTEEYERLLTSQVNIIYHCASQVNFDIPLKSAIITNVRGARELSNLALKCKNLLALLHVSTMYSNCDRDVTDEKVYPANIDWRDVIELAEDDSQTRHLEEMSLKYIEPFPNTYTFSKKISEQVFTELCKDRIPLVICRPSIIIYAIKEPVPGWTDNLNGPFSLLLGPTKGIIDVVYGNGDIQLDKVFVDNIIKTLIMATWKKCMDSDNTKGVTVYNACSDLIWKLRYYIDLKDICFWNVPMQNRFSWGGATQLIGSWYYYYYCLIIFNVIPALLGDLVLKLLGKKTILFKYQKKIFMANTFLSYFMNRTFIFKNEGYVTLEDKIMDCDRGDFGFREVLPRNCNKTNSDLAQEGLMGLKRFVLHEQYPIAPETFTNTKKFYILYLIMTGLKYLLIGYLIWRWNLHLIVLNKIYTYVNTSK